MLILVFVLFILTSNSYAKEVSNHRIALRYTHLDYKVQQMPLDFRSVPIHHDDSYALPSNWGPIKNEEYARDHWVSLDYAYLWNLDDHWSLGLGLVWILDFWDSFGDESRRNYTNRPGTETRGYGAALTFASTGVRGLLEIGDGKDDFGSILNFSPQIVLEYAFDKEKKSRLSLSVSYHRFVALNGWDRYDAFEVYDKKNLADIFPVTLSYSYRFIGIGASYNFSELSSFGQKANTEIGDFSLSIKIEGAF